MWRCGCIFPLALLHFFFSLLSFIRCYRFVCKKTKRSPQLVRLRLPFAHLSWQPQHARARARTSGYTSSRDQMVASCMKIFVTMSKYVKFVFNVPVNFWLEIRCRFGKVYCEVLGTVCKFNYSSSSAPVILLEAMCIFWFIINAVTIVIGGSPNLDNSNVAHFCSGCVQW